MATLIGRITTLLWSLLFLPLRIINWVLRSGDQTYSSLDHIALNVTRPQTEWMNMGHWENTDEFPQACKDLAELLYKEVGLKSSSSILDVGHGSGDSLLLLANKFSPRLLHGVTTMKAHATRSRQRLQQSHQEEMPKNVKVFCDDVVHFLKCSNEPTYDYILALDCAYHFQTRKEFLNLCYKRLKPGGKVALVDLAASHPYPSRSAAFFTPSPSLSSPEHFQASLSSRCKHFITTMLSGVPIVNLISIDQYHSDLSSAGFDEITIKDTSHLVFPGFARFLKGYKQRGDEAAWRGGGALQAIALRSFGSIVQDWSRGGDVGMVRSVVVVAAKKE